MCVPHSRNSMTSSRMSHPFGAIASFVVLVSVSIIAKEHTRTGNARVRPVGSRILPPRTECPRHVRPRGPCRRHPQRAHVDARSEAVGPRTLPTSIDERRGGVAEESALRT
jgi:hypothetical protein